MTSSEMDDQICAAIQASPYGKKLVDIMSHQFGPRPTGSEAMKKASEFTANVFRRIGAKNTHTEDVPVFTWRQGPSQVELISPELRIYDSVQHVHTTSANIEAALLDAGSGSDEQFDKLGDKIKGAIVLMHGALISGQKHMPISKYVSDACKKGALAVLVRNMYPGTGPAVGLAGRSKDMAIPVLGLATKDADELAAFAKSAEPRVRIETTGKSYRTNCANLIAEMGPVDAAGEVIILSAHLDSHDISPGAFDNLTGVATLIEIARALAPMQETFKRTLRLILFTGEEYDFQGSRTYVEKHKEQLDRIRFVFNMDGLFPSTAKTVAVIWAPRMRDYIDQIFRRMQCQMDVRNMFCMSSDYMPFMLAGVAAARPADCEDPNRPYPNISHTALDTPDRIASEWITLNAMNYARMLGSMLTDPQPLPTERKTPEQVQALITQEDAAEALIEYGCNIKQQ
ncbi:MAG: M20/M25/M40 family metallo-hydrolase [Desulfobacteraceae bacterium]|nr:M20/M25/M40 family metallo-hydrolase [Desulfobacteraceae bacterium]